MVIFLGKYFDGKYGILWYGVVVEYYGIIFSWEIEVGLKRKYLNLFFFCYRWLVNENLKWVKIRKKLFLLWV